jgi:hypothetical protein
VPGDPALILGEIGAGSRQQEDAVADLLMHLLEGVDQDLQPVLLT